MRGLLICFALLAGACARDPKTTATSSYPPTATSEAPAAHDHSAHDPSVGPPSPPTHDHPAEETGGAPTPVHAHVHGAAATSRGGTPGPLPPISPAAALQPDAFDAPAAASVAEAARASGGGHAGHDASGLYVCPMHPEVTSTEPGTCPKCGMQLEKNN